MIYGQGSKHGNRLRHILKHAQVDPTKPIHSVFDMDIKSIPSAIDEAWRKRGSAIRSVNPSNANTEYIVNMGRTVGQNGENSIKVVIKAGTESDIVTAFPTR